MGKTLIHGGFKITVFHLPEGMVRCAVSRLASFLVSPHGTMGSDRTTSYCPRMAWWPWISSVFRSPTGTNALKKCPPCDRCFSARAMLVLHGIGPDGRNPACNECRFDVFWEEMRGLAPCLHPTMVVRHEVFRRGSWNASVPANYRHRGLVGPLWPVWFRHGFA